MTGSTLRAIPAAAGLLLTAACAAPGDAADTSDAGDELPEQRYQVTGTVLESPDHGPQLCHSVADSLPPQCGGVDVVGWDWEAVRSESASGTTWGTYRLTGTFDGEVFTLTAPAGEPEADEGTGPGGREPDFSTPCPEPDGGWTPPDPDRATAQAQNRALERARNAPGFAGAWVDQSYLEGAGLDRDDPAREELANDPRRLVLNLRFTGDVAEREAEIREVWGGALCVTSADRTQEELTDIQRRLHEELPPDHVPAVLSSSVDVRANAVTAQVHVATEELHDRVREEYGEGAVALESWFQPTQTDG